MSGRPSGCCPACGARFRGAATCSRCGADLAPLMSLAASAFQHRREARRLLLAGDVGGALGEAREAQRLAATSAGEALYGITSCLAATSRGAPAKNDEPGVPGKASESPAGNSDTFLL